MNENAAHHVNEDSKAQEKGTVATLPTTTPEKETKSSGLTGPLSAIICSVILSASFLAGSGKFDEKPHEEMKFATVNYDGGYKVIGHILEQSTFSYIEIHHKKSREYRGSLSGAADWLNSLLTDENRNTHSLNNDVKISGNYGLEWTGSLGNFKLTTENVEIQNSDANYTLTKDVIRKLRNMDSTLKRTHMEESRKHITFTSEPKA